MKKSRIVIAASLAVTAGLLVAQRGAAQGPTEVIQVMNWFPQPEHGGMYAAMQDGLYAAKGLKMTISPGGPEVSGTSLLVTGRAQFAMTDAATLLLNREQGLPLVAVFASFQTFPQAFMYHKSNPLKSFADLAGRTVAVSPGAAYYDFIETKYNLAGKVKRVNYNGQLANFLMDKAWVTQCYATSEPYDAKMQGADVGVLMVADSGFNPYGNLMVTTEDFLKKNPAVVKAYVEATQQGWSNYLKDSTKYDKTLIAANKDLTAPFMKFNADAQVKLVTGGDAAKSGIGWMTKARFDAMAKQLTDLKLLKKPVDSSKVFTTEFIKP